MRKFMTALFTWALSLSVSSDAQVLCPGSGTNQPDQIWYSSYCNPYPYIYINDINTAMIDFPGSVQPRMNPGSLIGSVYSGNGTSGGVCFRDVNSGFTDTICYWPTGQYIVKYGDIIIGNDLLSPANTFRAAVAFYDLSDGLPRINHYRIVYTTPVSFTVTLLSTTTFVPPTPGDWTGGVIHLDPIADYGNTTTTGFPYCDNFVVTWDDRNGCWAHRTSLNAPTAVITNTFPATIFLPGSGLSSKPSQPDVAAIQRRNCITCPVEQIGLFAMSEGSQLVFQEFNWNTSTFSPITLFTPPFPTADYSTPRIDAPDNYNINNPSTPGLSYYRIATAVRNTLSPSFINNYLYDNMHIPGLDNGIAVYGTNVYSPTIAYGGNNGTQYQTSHYQDAYSSGGIGTPMVLMEPTNWMMPASLSVPDFYGGNQWYYQVNGTPPLFANGRALNAISTPANNPTGSTLCAWADHDPSVPHSVVYYKITTYGGAWGYTFRPTSEVEAASEPMKLYPNPAENVLNLEVAEAGNYSITDMLGRTQLSGALQAGSQWISIDQLAPGSYALRCQLKGKESSYAIFVKM